MKHKRDTAVACTERVDVRITNQQAVASVDLQRIHRGEQRQRVRLGMRGGITTSHNGKVGR